MLKPMIQALTIMKIPTAVMGPHLEDDITKLADELAGHKNRKLVSMRCDIPKQFQWRIKRTVFRDFAFTPGGGRGGMVIVQGQTDHVNIQCAEGTIDESISPHTPKTIRNRTPRASSTLRVG